MLITEKVFVKITARNFKHYKNMNYNLSLGTTIQVHAKDLTKASHAIVEVQCMVCKNKKNIFFEQYYNNSKKYGYYTCNGKCSKIKNKQTCIEKYGTNNYLDSTDFKEKQKTAFEKYGGSPFCNKEIQLKIQKTNLEKYGVLNPLGNKEIQAKRDKTNLERYGDIIPSKTNVIKEKFKNTCLERFGETTNLKTDENKEKSKNTSLKNYGTEHPMQNKIVQDKLKQTMLNLYGAEFPVHALKLKEKIKNAIIERYGGMLNGSEVLNKKIKKTNLEKYGFEYASQVPDIHRKQQFSKLNYYNEFYYRSSYELHFLKFCEENKIFVEQGKFVSYYYKNKKRVYFYDFILPSLNLIIEIKSNYTYNSNLEINLIKKETCLELGYNFLFVIDKKYDDFLTVIKNLQKTL